MTRRAQPRRGLQESGGASSRPRWPDRAGVGAGARHRDRRWGATIGATSPWVHGRRLALTEKPRGEWIFFARDDRDRPPSSYGNEAGQLKARPRTDRWGLATSRLPGRADLRANPGKRKVVESQIAGSHRPSPRCVAFFVVEYRRITRCRPHVRKRPSRRSAVAFAALGGDVPCFFTSPLTRTCSGYSPLEAGVSFCRSRALGPVAPMPQARTG